MKTIALTICLLASGWAFSQANAPDKVYAYILKNSGNTELKNKLLAINIWSSNNLESRSCNKNLDKATFTYQYAKLKGGLKGLVAFDICLDAATNTIQIIRVKDGIKYLQVLNNDTSLQLKEGNLLFDSNGQLVANDLQSSAIYETIHQLITR